MAYIELTSKEGNKFLANAERVDRFLDSAGHKDGETTYISGLTNNGGLYVRETYEEIIELLCKAGVLIIR